VGFGKPRNRPIRHSGLRLRIGKRYGGPRYVMLGTIARTAPNSRWGFASDSVPHSRLHTAETVALPELELPGCCRQHVELLIRRRWDKSCSALEAHPRQLPLVKKPGKLLTIPASMLDTHQGEHNEHYRTSNSDR
jgi:hypothetical protein